MTDNIHRIHVLGASGSGTTTFGRALAANLGFEFLDTDDYFWKQKYTEPNPVPDRIKLIQEEIQKKEKWVLSGSLCGWGDVFIPDFDLVVFIYLPHEKRMDRLKKREKQRYGSDILPGRARHQEYVDLIEWAQKYDTAGPEIRSKFGHEEWLKSLTCPILRFDGDIPVEMKLKEFQAFCASYSLKSV